MITEHINAQSGLAYHWGCFLATQANGLVQQLGHLLVVCMVLSTRPAGHKAIVLQLGHVLAGEPLRHTHSQSQAQTQPGPPSQGFDDSPAQRLTVSQRVM